MIDKGIAANDEYEKVTMYQCTWCGKLFKTNRLHKCKFPPKMRNCFSCRHCKGVNEITVFPFDNETTDVELICGIGKLLECAVPVREMAERHWKLACPKWQQLDDYKGKDSYMYHIVWQIDKRRSESE